jgi:hypothetical protein
MQNSKGNGPISSCIYAKWSSFFENSSDLRGSNRKSPVNNSNIMQAKLQISAVVLYLTPNNTYIYMLYKYMLYTSGDLYCLVCIKVLKLWWIQHALPRSAIFNLKSEGSSLLLLNFILHIYIYIYLLLFLWHLE